MSTLRSFAEALQKLEPDGSSGVTWTKPDTISPGFEHHRLTLPGTRTRPVTDVYELYWAHLFEQTSSSTFVDWISRIASRPISSLPQRFRWFAVAAWVVVAAAFVGLYVAWQKLGGAAIVSGLAAVPILALAYTAVVYQLNRFFLGTISDAARYLDATPRNVASRNAVRQLGVDFLDKLHKSDRQYGRIIVCGHSLGSVIGYDILQHLWYRYHETFTPQSEVRQSAFHLMSRAAAASNGPAAQSRQRQLWTEQIALGNRWRITDFVTLGSPLTHADVLMADSADEFEQRLKAGELSACPPRPDPVTRLIGFRNKYQVKGGAIRTLYLLKHSSLFAVTRWSNIYFENQMHIFGDPIAGPVAPLFGGGVQDVKVKARAGFGWFNHLDYWRGDQTDTTVEDAPLAALKRALELNLQTMASAVTPLPTPSDGDTGSDDLCPAPQNADGQSEPPIAETQLVLPKVEHDPGK